MRKGQRAGKAAEELNGLGRARATESEVLELLGRMKNVSQL